jgi:signal transduction histidine kinase
VRSAVADLLRRRRRIQALEGLHEISQAFAALTDVQETYGRLTRRIAELVGAEKCAICLYDPGTREMVGQAPGFGVSDATIKALRYRVEALLPAWNFRLHGAMVKNGPEEFHPAQRVQFRPFDLYNIVCVPLVLEKRILGMVAAGNKPAGFSQTDVRLLTVFAAQTAVAVQNARLYTRLQESAAQLEAKVTERTAELRATYRELADSHARLRELDRLKSDFLGNVSHELRTPLASIKGFVDNLLDGVAGPLAERQRYYLGRVRDNADRLGRMVGDLLDLTRIEAGKIELSPEALDAGEAATEAVESFRPVARGRGVDLGLDLAAAPPVWADRDKLQQVLTNLVSNAVKFTPGGGRVTVRVGPRPGPGRAARLEVADTGPGIPPGERDRVFDKFYQLARVDGERPIGTGLGLTIARHLVDLHGGRIWVETAAGPGSTFVVELPAAGEGGHAAM